MDVLLGLVGIVLWSWKMVPTTFDKLISHSRTKRVTLRLADQ